MSKKPNLQGLLDFLRIPYNLVSNGEELQTTCPLCGKPDHLYYNLKENVWICHKCGEAGGYPRFETEVLSYVVEHSTHQVGLDWAAYWVERGFTMETIQANALGYYAPLQRYTIPYLERDVHGDVVGVTNIAFRASLDGQEPKYIRLPGVANSPFVLGSESARLVVITEGEIDALSLGQCLWDGGRLDIGDDEVRIIGLPGATFVNDRLTEAIPRGARIIAVVDNDAAGKRAATKLKTRFPGIRCVVPGTAKDINELLVHEGEEAIRNLLLPGTPIHSGPVLSLPNSGDDEGTGLGASEEGRDGETPSIRGIPSPIYISLPDDQADWLVEDIWMDQAIGFVGGEPKAMKSLFTLHLAYHIAEGKPFCTKRILKPGPVVLFQEEDTDHLIRRRLKTINGGLGSPNLWLFTPGVTGEHLRLDSDAAMEMLDDAIRQIQPRLVVLDPLANMHGLEDENQSMPMNKMLERVRYLRDLRKCGFMIVHHLRKAGADDSSRPGQRLRGSGVLHAKAECGLYVDRTGSLLRIEVENKMAPNRVLEVKFVGNQFVYEDETGEGITDGHEEQEG